MQLNDGSEKVRVIMTHDVDWPIHGPSRHHLLQRKGRFDNATLSRLAADEGYNPYFGVPEIMDTESKYGVRSTFFFRPDYDDGSTVEGYGATIESLIRKGWEVGVHINNAELVHSILDEKNALEKAANRSVLGSRVHYLKIRYDDLHMLGQAGIKYDSSICFVKESLSKRNTGFFTVNDLVVFPITLMDTYMFTYMHVPEDKILEQVKSAIDLAGAGGIITILWHDNSLKMQGGRKYSDIVEHLATNDRVEVLRGIDAYERVSSTATTQVK